MSQLQLFAEPVVSAPTVPTPEAVRARLAAVLDALRSASGPGWSAKEFARWQVIVPQMADWLPADERDAVRAEFAALLAGIDQAAA